MVQGGQRIELVEAGSWFGGREAKTQASYPHGVSIIFFESVPQGLKEIDIAQTEWFSISFLILENFLVYVFTR